jgi:dTDP-4-amino-4,6-dideoxygalactose transaminase
MKVPLLDLDAHHAPIRAELLEAMERVLRGNAFILGPDVTKLEDRVTGYCGAAFGVGVSSGTDALLVSLMALGVGPGDEVVTTPYSFFATAGTVARLGATPVLVDIDPATYNIDAKRIEGAITPRTKAILPVHLFGQCADMEPIMRVASQHGLPVIEDAAQAIGARYADGRCAGAIGLAGCLSFFPSKNLGALGDAGMVVTSDAQLADRVRMLRAHGSRPKYYHALIGGNFRLDTLQAAVLNVKLKYLDGWTARRRENAALYVALFGESGLTARGLVRLPEAVHAGSGVPHAHIYNQFVVRVPDRERLRAHLAAAGIGTEVYYPVPFHLQECFRGLGHGPGDFPEAERAAAESLALPIYPELTAEMQRHVVDSVRAFYVG